MRKLFPFFAAVAFSVTAMAAAISTITTDKTIYSIGESAIVSVQLASEPTNAKYEFYVAAQDQSNRDITLTRDPVTGIYSGATIPFENVGTYQFTARVYLQDKRLAQELLSAIDLYQADADQIQSEIDNATSPEEIAQLQQELDDTVQKLIAAQDSLAKIRRLVDAPVNVSVQVQ